MHHRRLLLLIQHEEFQYRSFPINLYKPKLWKSFGLLKEHGK